MAAQDNDRVRAQHGTVVNEVTNLGTVMKATESMDPALAESIRALIATAPDTTNTEPAIESGPHLDDPEVRRIKREQLREYGLPEGATDEMRRIAKEKD